VWVLTGSLEAAAGQDAERRLHAAAGLVVAGQAAEPVPVKQPGQPGGVGAGGVGVAGVSAAGVSAGGVSTGQDPDVLVAAAPPPAWDEGFTTVTTVVKTPDGGVTVLARSSLEPVRSALNALRPLLLIGVPALLLLVAGLTWWLVGRALAPVAAIRTKFTEITASDLHQRVPVPAARDEVARLALAMNATLDRLEGAVQQHRRFIADAAHELRSPIATLRTRLELGGGVAPALAGEALVDVGRIQTLAADLLLLARLDAAEPLQSEEVDLGQVAAEAGAEAALRSGRADVRLVLSIAPDVVLPGSRANLGRMVGNLVDNALRHARSLVTVRVTGPAIVEVTDDGPGIPLEHRERVFDRFTRLDEARARDAGGCGLGLAISRDIAQAHGGTLVVTADADRGGACLRAELSSRYQRRAVAGAGVSRAGRRTAS